MHHRFIDHAHEAAEARGVFRCEGTAALRHFVKQTPCGVRLVVEENRVVAHELLQGGLQAAHGALHRGQQALILHQVLHHAADHLLGSHARVGCRRA